MLSNTHIVMFRCLLACHDCQRRVATLYIGKRKINMKTSPKVWKLILGSVISWGTMIKKGIAFGSTMLRFRLRTPCFLTFRHHEATLAEYFVAA